MRVGAQPTLFEALDDCHRQIGARMKNLEALVRRVETDAVDADTRRQAAEIESFFSNVSRAHHEQEESSVFPPLLAIGDAVLVETVQLLQQEHAWIETRWSGIAPQLRAIAADQAVSNAEEFVAVVREFLKVLRLHMELEDTIVYPESRTQWTRAVAARAAGETPPRG